MRNYLKVAESYRRGEIDDLILNTMSKQWTGYDPDIIRKIAARLDERYLDAKTSKRQA